MDEILLGTTQETIKYLIPHVNTNKEWLDAVHPQQRGMGGGHIKEGPTLTETDRRKFLHEHKTDMDSPCKATRTTAAACRLVVDHCKPHRDAEENLGSADTKSAAEERNIDVLTTEHKAM